MGKTIGFKDIVSCKIDDDPSFIPGRTTTYGTGISFFALVLEQRKPVQRQAGQFTIMW